MRVPGLLAGPLRHRGAPPGPGLDRRWLLPRHEPRHSLHPSPQGGEGAPPQAGGQADDPTGPEGRQGSAAHISGTPTPSLLDQASSPRRDPIQATLTTLWKRVPNLPSPPEAVVRALEGVNVKVLDGSWSPLTQCPEALTFCALP
ncbi:Hypothetical predicted protein [Marmota monax]|uniref:Uncharacterized protein n=1 Tax=Marmota monax TaxID=9995 RepID=A0A5E4AIY5_MARMO|nr:hypothetical protein GHT09_019831 [Marmota monax]VTJ57248.1 Hypothetical predicted protein [Marmota monax]